jgi:hypothetical protein
MSRMFIKYFTFMTRPLQMPKRNTILLIILMITQLNTTFRFTTKEIIRISKILQPWQPTNTLRNHTRKSIMRHIQLFQTLHSTNRIRQFTNKLIKTNIKHCHFIQIPDFVRQTAFHSAIRHNNLVNRILHIHHARWNTTFNIIIRENHNRSRHVSKIFRQRKLEFIVVNKKSIKFKVKKFLRNISLKIIESYV